MAIKKFKPLSPDRALGKTPGDATFARFSHLNDLVDEINNGAGFDSTLQCKECGDPSTFVTNVNGNTLVIGQGTADVNNSFISTAYGDSLIVALLSQTSDPLSNVSINFNTDSVTNDVKSAFEVLTDVSGTATYKGIGFTVDGATGESTMDILCWRNSDTETASVSFDSVADDALISIGTGNNTYDKDYFLKVATLIGGSPFFALKTDGAIETILPIYATNVAADADTSLPVGGLYQLTGDRTVYRKP